MSDKSDNSWLILAAIAIGIWLFSSSESQKLSQCERNFSTFKEGVMYGK